MTSSAKRSPVVVTGANGFVGSHVCAAVADRGVPVLAVVRRAGTAPSRSGVEERVGEFFDPDFAASVVAGATGVVTTVHPLGADRETQHRIGVDGTTALARAAADAGADRLVHISTAAVYDRSPEVGDVDEQAPLVGDDASAYAVTKRDADLALAAVDGVTRVLLRPPAILGAGENSLWNVLRPAEIRDDPDERLAVPDQTFAWVHVTDLATFAADVATGRIPDADDPERGPVSGACVPVNAAGGSARIRDYVGTVTHALGVEPAWVDRPAWTGRIVAARAHGWGWSPTVDLAQALAELERGLRPGP